MGKIIGIDLGTTNSCVAIMEGGDVAKIVDFSIHVSSSNTARIQETHITAGHAICELVDIKLFQKPDLK